MRRAFCQLPRKFERGCEHLRFGNEAIDEPELIRPLAGDQVPKQRKLGVDAERQVPLHERRAEA